MHTITLDLADLVIGTANTFFDFLQKDPNGRYRSWEHCYKCFHDARSNTEADHDYLSLQLAFYLASWGMYRGSSFLLQKDYKIHIPVVKELLKPQYDCLAGIECTELRKKDVQKRLSELESFMDRYYGKCRKSVKDADVNKNISGTLITKILMGTLGCVPAYDRYFIDGIKSQKVSSGNYNLKSILRLVDFYESNADIFERARKRFKVYGLPYPQMKLLDMGFWQIGLERDTNSKKE